VALGRVLGLVGSVLLLDCGSSFGLLLEDRVLREIEPQFIEFLRVLFTVVGVVNNEHVLLVVAASLESPVEGSSEYELSINDHELVVHMVLGCRVGSHVDTSIGELLNIGTLVGGALVVSDNLDVNAGIVAVEDSFAEVVVGDVEDADVESLLGHGDVLDDLLHVLLVGEEERVHVAGLGLVQVVFNLGDNLSQVGKHFLVSFMLHLLESGFEDNVQSHITAVTLATVRHLADLL
jgi:hypothetical protein